MILDKKIYWVVGLFMMATIIFSSSYWLPSVRNVFNSSSVAEPLATDYTDMLKNVEVIDQRHQQIEESAKILDDLNEGVSQLASSNNAIAQTEASIKQLEATLAAAEAVNQQIESFNTPSLENDLVDIEDIPSIEEVEAMYQSLRDEQIGITRNTTNEAAEYVMPPEVLQRVETTTGISGAEIEELMNR